MVKAFNISNLGYLIYQNSLFERSITMGCKEFAAKAQFLFSKTNSFLRLKMAYVKGRKSTNKKFYCYGNLG